ncbi:hypothetical protein AQJ84_11930 [Streptomyces resistomycificus]|uniref:Uncharacterized protein n=1 Tax=Streptomyces resistomycificus TaxID=67356 RepID=A0A0L8LXJ7_9ACTN|nr:hypothetical protein ADK37_04130 [Streptomyces resistomycificus]KUN99327.1 hypothetical protein AQJ84_11930 [Streptomyces resistomycificus]
MLGIYLNDHLAGATAGVERARYLAEAEQDPVISAAVRPLAVEITQDRASLLEIMRQLDVPVHRYKLAAGRLAEKAGRLKTNGRLVRRSPLTSLVELEALRLGVSAKAAGWETLRRLADEDERLDAARLDALLGRARTQLRTLEDLHETQTAETFRTAAA